MVDCPLGGCPDPLPTLTETLKFTDVAGGQSGEIVLLEITTPARGTLFNAPQPYTDITATLSHSGTKAKFYNGYQGNSTSGGFPPRPLAAYSLRLQAAPLKSSMSRPLGSFLRVTFCRLGWSALSSRSALPE